VLCAPGLFGFDGGDSRAADVVETSGEGSFAVGFVAVESDDVETMGPSVGGSDVKIVGDDGAAKDLRTKNGEAESSNQIYRV
jgi:hypothetical protein